MTPHLNLLSVGNEMEGGKNESDVTGRTVAELDRHRPAR